MKRFESGWLRDLNPGDRFYFIFDKKKSVWEVTAQAIATTRIKMIGSGRTDSISRISYKRRHQIVFLTSSQERE